MIPREGEALLNLHLEQARKTEREDFAELQLQKASAILGYALCCGHLSPVEYGGRNAEIDLIRAQRAKRRS